MTVRIDNRYVIPVGHRFVFGRGGGDVPVDLEVSDHPTVSKVAGWVEHGADGVVRVASMQRAASGSVSVERLDGFRIASVGAGAEHAVPIAEPAFVVVLRSEVVVRLRVDTGATSGYVTGVPSSDTQIAWTAEKVLAPASGDYWRLVAAVAAIYAARMGRPGHVALPKATWLINRLQRCQTAGLLPSTVTINQSWLTRQLDRAVVGLHLHVAGDKIPPIVEAVNGNSLLSADIAATLSEIVFEGSRS